MKRSILLVLLLLVACSSELPPTPSPPGGDAMAGKAFAGLATSMPSWAALPNNVFVSPQEAYYNDAVVVTVSDYQYIYSSAYIFNSKVRTWEPVTLQGEMEKSWVKGSAVASVPITELKFAAGENYMVVYACRKTSGLWDCNGNKWMLVKFTVKGGATGAIPEAANIEQFVIRRDIPPFKLDNVLAERDNFGALGVIRYDAKYTYATTNLVVVTHVFDFNSRQELDVTLRMFFKDIVNKGWKEHSGNNVAVFLADNDHMITVWTSGKELIYIETHDSAAANADIINGYLSKYPSDLKKV